MLILCSGNVAGKLSYTMARMINQWEPGLSSQSLHLSTCTLLNPNDCQAQCVIRSKHLLSNSPYNRH